MLLYATCLLCLSLAMAATSGKECNADRDCNYFKEACIDGYCKDLCRNHTECIYDRSCGVKRHVIIGCHCRPGVTGNTSVVCIPGGAHPWDFYATDGRFFFSPYTFAYWGSARDSCVEEGMRLATLRNKTDYDQLVNLLRDNEEIYSNSGFSFYIGAVYNNQQSRYIWNSTGQPLTYVHWAEDQPSQPAAGEDRDECVYIDKASNYRMKSISCNAFVPYICEYPIV